MIDGPPPGPDGLRDSRRLQVVADLGLTDHDPVLHLDAILRTLAVACRVRDAVVTIATAGRQVHPAAIGRGAAWTEGVDELSFGSAVVAAGRPLIVGDAATHSVYKDNPFVRDGSVRSYAAEPLHHRGVVVGSLAILDWRPRVFRDDELTVLSEQARLAETLLQQHYELRRYARSTKVPAFDGGDVTHTLGGMSVEDKSARERAAVLVDRLAEAMGGELAVSGEVAVGSTLTLAVTLAAARPSDTPAEDGAVPIGGVVVDDQAVPAAIAARPLTSETGVDADRPLHVLLAKDNLVNQMVAKLILAKLGHRVDIVDNGLEAVEAVQRGTYDVVLMDLQMPVLDGLGATVRIRAELPVGRQPAIVAVTANALAKDRAACARAGMDSFVAKPFQPADLRRALNQVGSFAHRPR